MTTDKYTDMNGNTYSAIYTKDDTEGMSAIRNLLVSEKTVIVVNTYETFYGVSFDSWLKNIVLEGMDYDLEVLSYNKCEGYPSKYKISLK